MLVDVGRLLFHTAEVMSSALSKASKTTTGMVMMHCKEITEIVDKCTAKFGKLKKAIAQP